MSLFDDTLRVHCDGLFLTEPTVDKARGILRDVVADGHAPVVFELGDAAYSALLRDAARTAWPGAEVPYRPPGTYTIDDVPVRNVSTLRKSGYRVLCAAPWAPFFGPALQVGVPLWHFSYGDLVPYRRAPWVTLPGVAYWHLSLLNGARVPMAPDYRPSQRALLHWMAAEETESQYADTANPGARGR